MVKALPLVNKIKMVVVINKSLFTYTSYYSFMNYFLIRAQFIIKHIHMFFWFYYIVISCLLANIAFSGFLTYCLLLKSHNGEVVIVFVIRYSQPSLS